MSESPNVDALAALDRILEVVQSWKEGVARDVAIAEIERQLRIVEHAQGIAGTTMREKVAGIRSWSDTYWSPQKLRAYQPSQVEGILQADIYTLRLTIEARMKGTW